MKDRTRREFMIQSSSLVAALAAGSMPGFAQTPKKKLGWALCGLGGLSEKQIAPALQKANFSRLAGVITDTPAKASKWKSKYGLEDSAIFTYDTMHELAENPDIDVIYIVTPNALHADQAAAAFKAGKHVFCEKPMEVSVERCQKMINDAKAANRKLAVAYRCQYDPNNLECVRIARAREFGDIKIVEATFNVSIGDPGQWRLKRALSGGGALSHGRGADRSHRARRQDPAGEIRGGRRIHDMADALPERRGCPLQLVIRDRAWHALQGVRGKGLVRPGSRVHVQRQPWHAQ